MPAPFPQRRRDRRSLWGVLVLYLAVAVLITWPLTAQLGTGLPDGTDTLLHYWNGWWASQALRSGGSPYHAATLFYPDGISMVYHNFPWLTIAPWMALRPLVGGVAAYNLVFLAHLALCGLAAYLLVRELAGHRAAALLGGLIYQCWPHRLSQPSHPNLMSTWAIPLFVLFLVRAIRRARWRDGLLAGLFFALVGYTRWQLIILAAIAGGIYALFRLRAALRRPQVWVLLLAAGTALLALAPPIALLANEWRANPADLVLEDEELGMQTDLLAYLTPPGSHPVFGAWTRPAYQRYYAGRGSRSAFYPYVGVVALALSIAGVATRRARDSLPWVCIALVLVAMALGPVLLVNGRLYPGVPMPYDLAQRLFVVRLLREPDRFNIALALPVAVLAGYGAAWVLGAVPRKGEGKGTEKAAGSQPSVRPWGLLTCTAPAVRRRCRCRRFAPRNDRARGVFALLLGGLIAFEYLTVPMAMQPSALPAFYAQLAEEPGEMAVLNIPVDPYRSKPFMYAQTVHGRPILQGHASRYPRGAFHTLDEQPWLRAMRQYPQSPPLQADLSRQLDALAQMGVAYAIVDKELVGAERWPSWARYLAVEPRYEDGEIAAYSTAPVAGTDFVLAPEMEHGIGIVRRALAGDCVRAGGALGLDVAWGARTPPGQDLEAWVGLSSGDGVARYGERVPVVEGWPTGEWPANAVGWGHYTLQPPEDLEPGPYAVIMRLCAGEAAEACGAPVEVATIAVQAQPCAVQAPPEAVGVNAIFGDAMRLVGVETAREGETLLLTLHWRGERRMGVGYKVFVHVYDPATGIPITQDDAVPLRWRFPTTLWAPGERVRDTIAISLTEVPPGAYGIAVGVYDPASMDRAVVIDAGGAVQSDGRLVLPGEVVEVGE